MKQNFTDLSASGGRRQLLMTASSQAALGLTLDNVFGFGAENKAEQRSDLLPASPPSLAEQVFNALASAKIWTSHIAMHLNREERDRYFRQLDLLHDCDEWFGQDKPVKLESYKNFVRFMLSCGGASKPSLALSSDGRLLAVWDQEGDRLTVEFGIDNSVHWVVSRREGGAVERAAGVTSRDRLVANIAPFNPNKWLKIG